MITKLRIKIKINNKKNKNDSDLRIKIIIGYFHVKDKSPCASSRSLDIEDIFLVKAISTINISSY